MQARDTRGHHNMYDTYVLNKQYFIDVLISLANTIEENRDFLSGLDSETGDGDHGLNLAMGFRDIKQNMDTWRDRDLTSLFRKAGMAVLGKVGGASGPLYGSFFMQFGEGAAGKNDATFSDLLEMFRLGVEAVENRGKARVGEKTMVDALRNGLDVFVEAVENQTDPATAFRAFRDAARRGARSTVPMIGTKGRARILGEKAVGHLDPGAASSVMIIEAFETHLPQGGIEDQITTDRKGT
jgi:phosphoenolpyruvate---glycerone phosphotransferase subunit DhaL